MCLELVNKFIYVFINSAFAKRLPQPHPALLGAAGRELLLITTYIYTGESQDFVWETFAGTTYLMVASGRFSKDLAGLGGATTSRLLGVTDLLVRGDPSA